MPNCIARIFEPLLRVLLPAPGRHRAPAGGAVPVCLDAATLRLPRSVPAGPSPRCVESAALVRPYVLAHEQREKARRQRARRRALWLAVHGVDIGPHRIHGVQVVT